MSFDEAKQVRQTIFRAINSELAAALSVAPTQVEKLLVWTSHFTDCSPFKSDFAQELAGLIFFEQKLRESSAESVRYIGNSPQICESLRIICHSYGRNFTSGRNLGRRLRSAKQSLRGLVDPAYQVAFCLGFWFSRRRLSVSHSPCSQNDVLLLGYLFNVDLDAAKDGEFRSSQWGPLPNVVCECAQEVKFAHLFTRSKKIPGIKDAKKVLAGINSEFSHKHTIIDGEITLRDAVKVARGGARRRSFHRTLEDRSGKDPLYPAMRPLFSKMWRDSIRTKWGVKYHLFYLCFLRYFERNQFKTLIFLAESQPWERAVLGAWSEKQRGRTIGVYHSSVLFWHLGIFQEALFEGLPDADVMMPKTLAVNGQIQELALRGASCRLDKVVQVEAIRYLHLPSISKRPSTPKLGRESGCILALGDISNRCTDEMLGLARSALNFSGTGIQLVFKAHPASLAPVNPKAIGAISVFEGALPEILGEATKVIASSKTSGMLDALLLGIPVAVFLQRGELNHSPLFGTQIALEVSNLDHFRDFLDADARTHEDAQNLLNLDLKMPLWRDLIGKALQERESD